MLIGFMSLIGSGFVWVDIQCANKYYVPAFAHLFQYTQPVLQNVGPLLFLSLL